MWGGCDSCGKNAGPCVEFTTPEVGLSGKDATKTVGSAFARPGVV